MARPFGAEYDPDMETGTHPIKLHFVGLSGYSYPHTRVRCFHFAKALAEYPDVQTKVLSYRDHLCPQRSEVDMFDHLRDFEKMGLVLKALKCLLSDDSKTLMYVQKAHFHSAAPYLLHRLLRRRYLFDYDDYDVELSVFFGRGTWNRLFFGTRDWDVITERMAKNAVACVASSHFLQEFLSSYNPRTYLIQTGVDAEQFKPASADERRHDDKTVFLWTGLVWGEEVFQSVLQILEAFRATAARCPNVTLQIVGGGQRMTDVETLVRQEYAHLDIQFTGWTPPQEMPNLLRRADVGLLPFAGDSKWFRSKSPTKLFEYMASGLAVVASSVGEITHVLDNGENGFLVDGVDGFAERMIELAENPDRRSRLGAAAREKALQEYSLPKLAEKLHSMLVELRTQGML